LGGQQGLGGRGPHKLFTFTHLHHLKPLLQNALDLTFTLTGPGCFKPFSCPQDRARGNAKFHAIFTGKNKGRNMTTGRKKAYMENRGKHWAFKGPTDGTLFPGKGFPTVWDYPF